MGKPPPPPPRKFWECPRAQKTRETLCLAPKILRKIGGQKFLPPKNLVSGRFTRDIRKNIFESKNFSKIDFYFILGPFFGKLFKIFLISAMNTDFGPLGLENGQATTLRIPPETEKEQERI